MHRRGVHLLSVNRIRQIKPDFFEDEKITSVSFISRLFFIGLWCRMDRNGLVEDSRLLKNLVFPLDDDIKPSDIDKLVDELCNTGLNKDNPGMPLLVRVKSGNKRYLYAPQFIKHQSANHRERAIHLISLDILNNTIDDLVQRGEVPGLLQDSTPTRPVPNGLWVKGYGIWVMGLHGETNLENSASVDNSVETVDNPDTTDQLKPEDKKTLDKLLGRKK